MTQTNWKILAATTTGSFFANVDAALETYLKTSGPSSGVVGALGAAFITGTYETWPGLAGTTATRFPIILVNTSGGANRTEAGANAECSCVTEIRICDSNANARAAAAIVQQLAHAVASALGQSKDGGSWASSDWAAFYCNGAQPEISVNPPTVVYGDDRNMIGTGALITMRWEHSDNG
jgi:hypothetical protein